MKVLIADDNAESLYILETLLKGHGWEVTTAVNGEDAMEHLRRARPDLIISDVLMPKMDGFQFCRAVKTDAALKDIPVIFYTATYTAEKDRDFALSLGASRFIIKPSDHDEFIGIVKEVMVQGEKGLLRAGGPSLENETEYLKEHQARLINKLEDKLDQLQEAYKALEREIEERKKAEQELRKKEGQYRTLVENMPDYVMRYDRRYRHLFTNSATLRDNSKTAGEFVGKTHREMGFDPNLCDTWEHAIEKVFETGQPQTEVFEWNNAFGKTICLEWRVFPEYAPDGSIETVLGISRDITEQKLMEKALQEAATRYRIVANNTSDWEFWLDPEGKFKYTSPACGSLTGHTVEEFMADQHLLSAIIHPEERPGFDKHLHEASSEKKRGALLFRIVRPDGTFRWIDHVCQPVFDPEGGFLGTRGSNRDITKRKTVEEERERLVHELEDALVRVKQLSGLLPICSYCKKIRDEKGYWEQVESYITKHSEALFSHSICQECEKKAYEDLEQFRKDREKK